MVKTEYEVNMSLSNSIVVCKQWFDCCLGFFLDCNVFGWSKFVDDVSVR